MNETLKEMKPAIARLPPSSMRSNHNTVTPYAQEMVENNPDAQVHPFTHTLLRTSVLLLVDRDGTVQLTSVIVEVNRCELRQLTVQTDQSACSTWASIA